MIFFKLNFVSTSDYVITGKMEEDLFQDSFQLGSQVWLTLV